MAKFVKKYLIPNQDNEYKPHLFRKAGILFITFVAIGIFAVGIFQTLLLTNTSFLSSVLPAVLVDLTNQSRHQNELAMLTANPLLEKAAQEKANDMAAKGYFAHNSPDGKTPWYWFYDVGYKFTSAGENLAINFTDSSDVENAWMNSPGHRANILNGKFTEIGIATAQGIYNGRQTTFVVQLFGKPSQLAAATAPVTTTPTVPSVTPKPAPTTTVLGESTPPSSENKVLSQTETFVAVDAPAEPTPQVTDNTTAKTGTVEKLATSPKHTISLLYKILAGIVMLGLFLMIFVEIKHQHPKNVIAGVLLILFILGLMWAYQYFLGSVVVV